MSTSLYWRIPPAGTYLGGELKYAVAPRLWQHDGSLGSEWTAIDRTFIPFLEGIEAGAPRDSELAKQARNLIDLLGLHGMVELCLAWSRNRARRPTA